MRRYRIIVTEYAKRDLKDAVRYIAHELKNPAAAARLADEFEKRVLELEEMPERYQVLQDQVLASSSVRAFSVSNYRVFYTVHHKAECVTVLRFLYGKRNWSKVLRENVKELGES